MYIYIYKYVYIYIYMYKYQYAYVYRCYIYIYTYTIKYGLTMSNYEFHRPLQVSRKISQEVARHCGGSVGSGIAKARVGPSVEDMMIMNIF